MCLSLVNMHQLLRLVFWAGFTAHTIAFSFLVRPVPLLAPVFGFLTSRAGRPDMTHPAIVLLIISAMFYMVGSVYPSDSFIAIFCFCFSLVFLFLLIGCLTWGRKPDDTK